jgi:small subunit ribosomal protein S6
MLILPAEADEALVSTAVERIDKVISPSGGAVGTLDRWGRRRFAYEIDRQHEGYYVVLRFTAEPSVQTELERVLKLADEVIRHKILLAPPARAEGSSKEPRRSQADRPKTDPPKIDPPKTEPPKTEATEPSPASA